MVIIPFIVPFSRRIRTSFLVSMPSIPGMSYFMRNSGRLMSHLKFDGMRDISLTITASGQALSLSISSMHTP